MTVFNNLRVLYSFVLSPSSLKYFGETLYFISSLSQLFWVYTGTKEVLKEEDTFLMPLVVGQDVST